MTGLQLALLGFVLGVVVAMAAATTIATRIGRTTAQARAQEFIDLGYVNGLLAAVRVAAGLPKPYITMTQEQGWDLAHRQHVDALRAHAEEAQQTGKAPAHTTREPT